MSLRYEEITPGPAVDVAHSFAGLVPVLETDNAILRPVHLTDFADYAEIVCSERGRYVGGPYSREDAWFDFLSLSSGWMLHGHGGWAVEATASGKLAGFVCLGLEPGDHEVELGFLLRARAEGQSFAYEAAKSARAYAWNTLKLKTVVSYIDPRNARSITLATRLRAFDDTPADFEPGTRVFRHLPPKGHS